jgi:PIN domain nuclease of toxin-antitoxin system
MRELPLVGRRTRGAAPGGSSDDPVADVFTSAVSVWEIAIKRRRGKLTFLGPIVATIADNGFHELPILPIDAEQAGALEWQHTDPFDRLLVARAMRLGFTLVTADRSVRAFRAVAQVWAG